MDKTSDLSRRLVMAVPIWQRIGGLEAVNMDIAATFAAMGWEVRVFSIFDAKPSAAVPGVTVTRLGPSVAGSWPDRIWRRILWRFSSAATVRAALRGGGVFLCGHVHLLPLLDFLPRRADVARMGWVHGIDVWGGEARRWVSRLNRLDRVVAVSRFTAEQVRGAGLRAPLDIVPNSVDSRLFAPTRTPDRIRRREVLICGRMAANERYKGHEVLLEAMPLAEQKLGQPLDLRIVGTGDDMERIRKQAAAGQQRGAVTFAGRLPVADLIEAYQHGSVFCMPSRVERQERGYWSGEGFGIVYIEAAACGRPVIASGEGGAPDTVRPGVTGLLVDPRSPSSVAEAIADILRHPARADELGANGRRMVEECFSTEVFQSHLRGLISRLETARS